MAIKSTYSDWGTNINPEWAKTLVSDTVANQYWSLANSPKKGYYVDQIHFAQPVQDDATATGLHTVAMSVSHEALAHGNGIDAYVKNELQFRMSRRLADFLMARAADGPFTINYRSIEQEEETYLYSVIFRLSALILLQDPTKARVKDYVDAQFMPYPDAPHGAVVEGEWAEGVWEFTYDKRFKVWQRTK